MWINFTTYQSCDVHLHGNAVQELRRYGTRCKFENSTCVVPHTFFLVREERVPLRWIAMAVYGWERGVEQGAAVAEDRK